jgi:UDP-3-O-[3-hydroxymyristoyl] glucosamine N-acyltransferase
MKLSDIAKALRGEVTGDGTLELTRLVHPADADGKGDLAVALAGDALGTLSSTRAGAAVVKPGTRAPAGLATIEFAGHERMALAILTRLFDIGPGHDAGVHATAFVSPTAIVAESASIGPLATVGPGSTVGDASVILASVTVGEGVTIGRDCLIHSGARIGDRVRLGDRVIIHANAVIGSDGFSFIPVRNPDGSRNPIDTPARVHSLGTVILADDVEVGASTTIDRGTLRDTRIGRGTKIDNQVQIAHNVTVGENCLICGSAGVAGSVVIGDRVILGAGAGVADHVTIASDGTVAAMSGTASNVASGVVVSGTPATPHNVSLERYVNVGRLKVLYPKVDDLKKRVEALEKGDKGG